MKRLSIVFVAVLASCLTVAMAQDNHKPQGPATRPSTPAAQPAHPAPATPPAAANSAAAQFEMLKKLAGEWTGKATHGQMENADIKVIYKVTSSGSAVMETLFAGSDHEMITMYTMDGNDLVLTHYCSMGNQPHMKAQPGKDANTINFLCAGKGGNMKSENDQHMHAATFTFVDANHFKTSWTMQKDGKTIDTADFELARKTA